MTTKIADLELSVRATNALKNNNITTVEGLVASERYSLLRQPNFGQKSLKELDEVLDGLGYEVDSNHNWSKKVAKAALLLRKRDSFYIDRKMVGEILLATLKKVGKIPEDVTNVTTLWNEKEVELIWHTEVNL